MLEHELHTWSGELNLQMRLRNLSDDLTQLNSALNTKVGQFVSFIDKFYYPKRLTPRITEFYRFELKEFIEELEDQQIYLRTWDTMEVIDLFDYFKKSINDIQDRINDKQGQIKTLVELMHQSAMTSTKTPNLAEEIKDSLV